MAALLTIEAANTDKLAMYLGECRDLGIPILPPDINSSELAFTVEKDGVRFGLCAVKNVGEGAILSMLARAQGARPHRLAVHAVRARRPAAGQQARARKPGQGRRVRLARRTGRSADRGARRLFAGGRQGDRARRPPSARPREGTVAAVRRPRRRRSAGGDAAARRARRGPKRSSSRSRRKRSAST